MPTKTRRKTHSQGGSLTISIPKEFVNYYGIAPKQPLPMVCDGKIIIYPSEEEYEKDKERAAAFLQQKPEPTKQ